MQQCDAGITAAMKIHYRAFQLDRAFDFAEGGTKNMYHLEKLSATLTLEKIRNGLSFSVIHSCWQHTGILLVEISALLLLIEETQRKHICSMVAELFPSRNRISTNELLCPPEKEECSRKIAVGVIMKESKPKEVEE